MLIVQVDRFANLILVFLLVQAVRQVHQVQVAHPVHQAVHHQVLQVVQVDSHVHQEAHNVMVEWLHVVYFH